MNEFEKNKTGRSAFIYLPVEKIKNHPDNPRDDMGYEPAEEERSLIDGTCEFYKEKENKVFDYTENCENCPIKDDPESLCSRYERCRFSIMEWGNQKMKKLSTEQAIKKVLADELFRLKDEAEQTEREVCLELKDIVKRFEIKAKRAEAERIYRECFEIGGALDGMEKK